jgi:hypothetical protein
MLGRTAETTCFPVFQAKFPDLVRIKNPYALFDFESPECRIELKARTTPHDKYPTTIVGENKVQAAEKDPRAHYFAFAFTDGLYWVQYDKDLFADFEVKDGGRRDRGRPEIKPYRYIPITALTKVCDFTPDVPQPTRTEPIE